MPGFRLPWKTRSQVTSEVEEELRYHLDEVAAGLRAGGMSEAEARAEAMGGFFYADRAPGMDLTGQGEPVELNAALVTDGFFETLGTPPLLGRALVPEDNVPGKDRVAVLSYSLWAGRFGADRSLPGKSITLNGQPFVVAGVMPAGFTYPADRNIDLWIPLSFFGPEAIGRERSK